MLFGLRARLDKRRAEQALERKKAATINAAIDHLIDGIDPNMRLILGYKKRLTETVEVSLQYIDRLVEKIPGPVEFDKKAFGTNPLVNAVFATASDLQKTFSKSDALRGFFENSMNINMDYGYALMCMEKEEHAGFGIELEGDFIKKDVARVSVNFFGHRLLSPAATEKAVRESVKNCIFDALISNTYEHIMASRIHKAGSDEYRQVLEKRYKARQAWGQELTDLLLSIRADALKKYGGTKEDVADKKQGTQNGNNHIETPSERLELVKDMLSRPEKIIRLNHIIMNLTRMGIKVDDASGQSASKIELTELEIDDVWRRIIVIVKYPRNEMLEKTNLF
jgi:hypothetical protein